MAEIRVHPIRTPPVLGPAADRLWMRQNHKRLGCEFAGTHNRDSAASGRLSGFLTVRLDKMSGILEGYIPMKRALCRKDR